MDKIVMKNLSFYGYHGVLQEEKALGQQFFADVTLYLDLSKAGSSDQLNDTVNYAKAFETVRECVENRRFDLIEALAEAIAGSILAEFQLVNEVKVRIRKPKAPVEGIFDYFGVEIRRGRDE